jgi:hypothetical protein
MVQTIIKNDKPMTLKEMQDAVNGTIELVFDNGDTQIVCNEEGKLMNLPENERATDILWDLLEETEYAHILSNYDVLVGDVLILKGKARIWI